MKPWDLRTEWHPAIASTVANHYIGAEEWERSQKEAIASVLDDIIAIVGFEAGPPYDPPLFKSIYSVPRLLTHIRAGWKP